jgi:CBS domain containing-hemolysin-like protein
MAAVIDEWGALEGIATIEDVVEALVGDLRDSFDVDEREHSVRKRGEGTFDIDGGVRLSVVNDAVGADFASTEVETIGGLVLAQLDRAPETGDRVEMMGYALEVTSVEGTRIGTVQVDELRSESA